MRASQNAKRSPVCKQTSANFENKYGRKLRRIVSLKPACQPSGVCMLILTLKTCLDVLARIKETLVTSHENYLREVFMNFTLL